MKTKLTKRPATTTATQTPRDELRLEKFIGGAPDSAITGEAQKSSKREGRKQISHTLPPALLKKIDEKSDLMGLTRAGLINLAVSEFVNR